MPPWRVSGRNPRVTRACARCRQRKIKCDFVYPKCGTCLAAHAECVGFDPSSGQEQPRSAVSFLESNVAHLEIELAALKDRAKGKAIESDEGSPFSGPRRDLLRALSLREGSDRAYDDAFDARISRSMPFISPSVLPTLCSARAPAEANRKESCVWVQKRDIASIPRQVVDIMLHHYSEFYLAQYPILDESELVEKCNRVYERTASTIDSYVVCMALAISVG